MGTLHTDFLCQGDHKMLGAEAYALEPLEDIDEQSEFLSILYHDARGGAGIRMLMKEDNGQTVVRHFGSRKIDELEYRSMSCNAYVTVNSFKSYKRKTEEVYNYSGIFIDLDGHSFKSTEAMDKAIDRTRNRLARAFRKGEISAPTMITHTGRGLGIYYVLKKSIANVPKAKKSIEYLEQVRAAITAKYKRILDGSGYLEVDCTVKDAARVCRLPLTMNKNINRWCRLIHTERDDEGEPRYYDLKELAEQNHLFDEINAIRNRLKEKKVVGIDEYRLPFLTIRLQKLEMLQELRGYKCQGTREYMLFIYYNAAKQIYGGERGGIAVKAFNDRFVEPLPDDELQRAIAGVDRNVPPTKDYQGFYKLPDAWVVESLGVTDEENRKCRFGASRQQIERQRTKEANRQKRKQRNDTIAEYIRSHPDETYPAIAVRFAVSESMIYRICKEYEIRRYRGEEVAQKESTEVQEQTAEVSILGDSSKSSKFASEYLGVSFSGEGESVCVCITPAPDTGPLDGLVQAYSDLYGQVVEQRRRKRQIPGQLGFRCGPDGDIQLYEVDIGGFSG